MTPALIAAAIAAHAAAFHPVPSAPGGGAFPEYQHQTLDQLFERIVYA